MLWSKQFFYWDATNWLKEHRAHPLHNGRQVRNRDWFHMVNGTSSRCPTSGSIPGTPPGISRSTRCRSAMVDPDFAKKQMQLMLRGGYLHPNGQLPAYEWNFSDVNPPVHAFATLFLHRTELRPARRGRHRLPQGGVQQAPGELHLVGQSQGSLRQERLRRAASSGSTTSACSTAARRCRPEATSSRRTARRGWPSSRRTCSSSPSSSPARSHLRGHGLQVHGALRLHRRGHEQGGAGRHVGRGGWFLLRHPAAPRRQRHAAQGALDGGAAAHVRHDGDRQGATGACATGRERPPGRASTRCPSS